jgi:hypothetical protein
VCPIVHFGDVLGICCFVLRERPKFSDGSNENLIGTQACKHGDQMSWGKKSPKVLPNPFFVKISAQFFLWKK